MRCPKCDSENNDSAKFCKKCGTPLKKKTMSHESMINSMNEKSGGDNTTKYIIIALIVVAVVLAGAFVYIYGFGSNQSNDAQVNQADNDKIPHRLKPPNRHSHLRRPVQCRYLEEALKPEAVWKTRPMHPFMSDLNIQVKMLRYRFSIPVMEKI